MGCDIIPGGAQPQHGAHALADAGDGILGAGSFVVIGGAARRIGMEGQPQIGRGIVAADGLAGVLRGGDFGQHLGVAVDHAGKVHHLAEPDDIGPGHGFAHVVRPQFGAGVFEAGGTGNTGWHLHEDVDRQAHRLVMHQAHAGQAQHIGDLVRIDEHRGGAMRDHGAGEFGDRHHAALDMHVAIAQTRHHVAALGFDDFCLRPDGVRGIGPDIGETASGDGDVGAGNDFARMDVDPGAVADDHVGLGAPHGGIDKPMRGFGPGFQSGHLQLHGSAHYRQRIPMCNQAVITAIASSSRASEPAVMTLPPWAGFLPVHSAAAPPAPNTIGSRGEMS